MTTQTTKNGLRSSSLKKLLFGGIALGMAVSAWATPSQGLVCLTDIGGVTSVTYSNLNVYTTPPITTTTSAGYANINFLVSAQSEGGYFFSPYPGYAILTQLGVPQFVVKYNVSSTGPNQDSVNISLEDPTYAGYASLYALALAGSDTYTVALTGPNQNISADLEPSGLDESPGALAICIQCATVGAPDTTPTWPLLGLALVGMVSLRRFVPSFHKALR